MRFRLGNMSVGDILDRGLKLLFGRLGTFYAINVIVQSPLIALEIMVAQEGWPSTAGFLGIVLLIIVLFFFGMGASIKVIEQEYIDRRIGAGAAILFALTRLFSLMLAALAYIIVVVLALIPSFIGFALGGCAGSLVFGLLMGYLLSIFGIYVAVMCSLVCQAVMLESLGPLAGLNRSQELTRGHRWRIFWILLLTFLLLGVVSVSLELAFEKLIPAEEFVRNANGSYHRERNQSNMIIQIVVKALVTIVFNTYAIICLTLAYFDLRARKEGFDLELAALGMPQEPRPSVDNSPRRFLDDDDDREPFDDRRSEWRE